MFSWFFECKMELLRSRTLANGVANGHNEVATTVCRRAAINLIHGPEQGTCHSTSAQSEKEGRMSLVLPVASSQ